MLIQRRLAAVKLKISGALLINRQHAHLAPKYDSDSYFRDEGLSHVALDGKHGFIDKTGNPLSR